MGEKRDIVSCGYNSLCLLLCWKLNWIYVCRELDLGNVPMAMDGWMDGWMDGGCLIDELVG